MTAVWTGQRQCLFREARAAARIDHPNVCSVYEIAEEQDKPFIVMQWVDGETLASRLARSSLDLHEALNLAVRAANAVSRAHTPGIIHRDIKPRNFLIGAHGLLKVMDFGLAKSIVEDPVDATADPTQTILTRPSAIPGTLPYMSPEQLRGEPLDTRSDLFSFGPVLYEAINGQQPFKSASPAVTCSGGGGPRFNAAVSSSPSTNSMARKLIPPAPGGGSDRRVWCMPWTASIWG